MLKKILKFVLNPYFIILLLFAVWVLFFDQFNIQQHRELNQEYQKMKTDEKNFLDDIRRDSITIEKMKNDPEFVERTARETYYFRAEDERIFVIDSTLSDSTGN